MQTTPRSNRLAIGFFGRRNAGKSSLLNALSGQTVAIVSDVPGTTADPVFKSMELHPLGPVTLMDTAGLDDVGELGVKRSGAAYDMLKQVDLAVVVCEAGQQEFTLEKELLAQLEKIGTPVIFALNKVDRNLAPTSCPDWLASHPVATISALAGTGLEGLRTLIIEHAPVRFETPPLLKDVLPKENALVVLVAPQDKQAPRGRLILPQAQTIRDALEEDVIVVVTTPASFQTALQSLARTPDLVVCDSQVFHQIAALTPDAIPLTSFSILMARAKGDLLTLAEGAKAIAALRPGDAVLIAEACTHHPMENDIGRIQLPKKLSAHVGGDLKIDVCAGKDFPKDLKKYRLVLQCGGCMLTRRAYLARMAAAREAGVPITNYGVALGYLNGLLPRVTDVFFNKNSASATSKSVLA